MLSFPRWRVWLCLAAVLLGLVFTAPNVLPSDVLSQVPAWAPHQKLNLGLDLQGGSYLLLEVDTDALKTERLTNLVEDVRKTLADQQVAFTELTQANGVVHVRITDPGQVQNAQQQLQKLGQPMATGGRDVAVTTGADQSLQLKIADQALVADASKAVDQSIEIIRRRIDALGTREPSIVRQGVNRIVVEAPGESDPERLKSVIGQTAKLTFQMVDDSVPVQEAVAGRVPPDSELLPDQDAGPNGPPILVKRRPLVSGEMLTSAAQSFDQYNRPAISFRFNGVGAQRFAEATSQNVGKRFAIVLDNKVLSAPNILEPITGGSGEITGSFTLEQASNLALMLRSGALPAPLKIVEQRTVGAELGADSVRAGALAGIIAIVLIAVFMILAYGFVFGGISVVGLLMNMAMILGTMSMIGATLTLPGIAGLILTVAMAVDANVLIFERIRDEERAGRKPALAIDTGFSRATVSILDANITTLIAALILFQFGAGPVRGFAWTLSIGVLTSVFSALFITRMLVVWWYRSIRNKRLPI
ncbi:MAG: protein translocase subunit SecD [Caulobacteraceae bacterium]|nr:protein translocase subunit SecD [Caulobacteraceae bacterium]